MMRKKNIYCALLSLAVMILLPWCAVTFVRGDGGMAVCFLLFFAVNPLVSLGVGVFAGRNLKSAWFQLLLCPLLFLAGTWLFFDMGESAFAVYAGVYLALGCIAAVISRLAFGKSN